MATPGFPAGTEGSPVGMAQVPGVADGEAVAPGTGVKFCPQCQVISSELTRVNDLYMRTLTRQAQERREIERVTTERMRRDADRYAEVAASRHRGRLYGLCHLVAELPDKPSRSQLDGLRIAAANLVRELGDAGGAA